MGAALIIAGVGAAISAGGSFYQASQQKKQTKASQRAENARHDQADWESMLKKRQEMRKAQQIRAATTSTATAQGANLSDSAVQGSFAQGQASEGEGLFSNYYSGQITDRIFDANADASKAAGAAATGNSISGFGAGLIKASGTIYDIGTEAFGGDGEAKPLSQTKSDSKPIDVLPGGPY